MVSLADDRDFLKTIPDRPVTVNCWELSQQTLVQVGYAACHPTNNVVRVICVLRPVQYRIYSRISRKILDKFSP